MSRKIIGVTVGSPLPKPNLMQDDPTKGDYVEGKEEFLKLVGGAVLSDAEKTLLITILRNAAYSNNQSANITALEALFDVSGGGGTLTGITATYSGGDVAVGTAVTALTGIVVTAHYSDGSTQAVTDYALSGTITEGSNTITVSHGGKTTTFTVTGVAESATWELITMTYMDCSGVLAQKGAIYSDEGVTNIGTPGRGFLRSEVFDRDTDISLTAVNNGTTAYVGYGVVILDGKTGLIVYNATALPGGKTQTFEMTIPSGNQLIVCGNYSQHMTVEAKKKVVA